MKIDKSKVENQQVTLTLEVEEDEIDKYLVQAAKKLSNQLKIPGFRKGKAPKSIVEKVVGREGLVEESLQFSVPNLVNDAIDKENLEVFATPKISVIDLVPILKLEAKVALKPNAKIGKLEDIKLDVIKDKISAKEVNNIIEQSRNQHASWVPVKRKSKIGDLLSLDGAHSGFSDQSQASLNKLIQGSAADMTKKAMLELYKEGILAHIQIHDELDLSVESDAQAKKIIEIMENAVSLEVPNKVDYESGKTWGDIYDKD
mgnify:CR=1 FL=1